MSRNIVEEIGAAILRIKNGTTLRSTSRLTAVDVSKEARISRATLYRFLDKHECLRTAFDEARNYDTSHPVAPLRTMNDAYSAAKEEIKELREALAESKKLAAGQEDAFVQKLFLLKRMVSHLDSENCRLKASVEQHLAEKNKFSAELQNLKIENAHLKRTQDVPATKSLHLIQT